MKTERDKLRERFQSLKGNGLRDLKFFLGSVSEETVERVCGEVNKVYDLVESKNLKQVTTWGDSARQ